MKAGWLGFLSRLRTPGGWRFSLAGLSLRERIAVTMMLLVTAAGLLLAVWAVLANRRLELNITYDLLAEELTHYQQRMHVDPGTEPLQSAQLRIYRPRDLSAMPRAIARYAPGTYGPVRIDGRYLRVLVRDTEFGRLYITYDVTRQLVEQRIATGILAVGVITTIVLTAWLAYALSGKLVNPIRRLANRLSDIDPGERQQRIATDFAGNELQPIAQSIDGFLERLDGFVEREQSFTATASHELRTPLAVVQGAVELLNEQLHDQPQAHKALARIHRAVREMANFTDALLLLSREERRDDRHEDSCDLSALLPRIVDDQQAMARNRRIQLTLNHTQPVLLAAPDSMVAMVVGNLLRNALQHQQNDEAVICELDDTQCVVRNRGHIPPEQLGDVFKRGYTTRAGGHGMGLYLARRICDRYGWTLTLQSEHDHVVATLSFAPTATHPSAA